MRHGTMILMKIPKSIINKYQRNTLLEYFIFNVLFNWESREPINNRHEVIKTKNLVISIGKLQYLIIYHYINVFNLVMCEAGQE